MSGGSSAPWSPTFAPAGLAQGGSTLTQQLAKNLFLDASRTPLRKLREAAMASVLEMRYSKSTILEAYLNEIYLGQDGARAIHGVGAASRFYFGKNVQHLTLAESALLAATINAPNHNAPNRHPDVARQRRDLVLQLMVDQHRVTSDSRRTGESGTGVHAGASGDDTGRPQLPRRSDCRRAAGICRPGAKRSTPRSMPRCNAPLNTP